MQKKKEKTMNRIFDSAEALFAQKSFYDVKIEDIAKNAGVGKGTVYTYFKSKEELLLKAIVNKTEENQKELLSIINSNDSFMVRFHALFRSMYLFFKIKGPLIQQHMRICPKIATNKDERKMMMDKFKKGLEILSGFFKEGIDEGILIDSMTPRQFAIVFQKMFDFNVFFTFYGDPEMSADDAFKFFTKTFVRDRSW